MYYWISAGHDYWSARNLTRKVAAEHPRTLLHRTGNHWRSWVHAAGPLEGLTEAHGALFLTLRSDRDRIVTEPGVDREER